MIPLPKHFEISRLKVFQLLDIRFLFDDDSILWISHRIGALLHFPPKINHLFQNLINIFGGIIYRIFNQFFIQSFKSQFFIFSNN
jgi:hypothetical protein